MKKKAQCHVCMKKKGERQEKGTKMTEKACFHN
jgi:hypothetical protein